MPALLILAVISWLLGSGKTRPKVNEPGLFTVLERHPRRHWGAWFLSVVAHAFGLLVVLVASDIFSTPDDDYFARQMAGRALLIRLPDRIYLAPASGRTFPSTAHLARRPRTSVRRNDLRKYAEGGVEARSIHPSSGLLANTQQSLFSMMPPLPEVQAERRKFVLPDLPVRESATQTLLQAELPNLPPQVENRLPQLFFWAAELRDPKTPPPDQPVQPGNLATRVKTPELHSTPRLEVPNLEPLTADFRIRSAPTSTASALTLPPATTMPLRLLEPENKEPDGQSSIDPFTGQPVHVLALSPDPAPLTDAFKSLFIPAGNQLARLPGAPPLFDFEGLAAASANTDGAGGGAGGDGGSPFGFGGGEFAAGPAELLHSFPGDARLFGFLASPRLTGTPLRILHPSNGVFDVVVVQSSSAEAFPEGAEALSGRPIYTVYLQVGAPKEWIMQYCVPDSMGAVQTGNIVNLGNPPPVSAPYPMVTVRPPEDWRHGDAYLLVHGFLDAGGRFHNMKILPGYDPAFPTTDALLDYLAYWEFRPAAQDGRPVMVEVILAVPPDHVT